MKVFVGGGTVLGRGGTVFCGRWDGALMGDGRCFDGG